MADSRAPFAIASLVAALLVLSAIVLAIAFARNCTGYVTPGNPPPMPAAPPTMPDAPAAILDALRQPRGAIEGRVRYVGPAVTPVAIDMSAIVRPAGAPIVFEPRFDVNADGTLPHVFVHLKGSPVTEAVARRTVGADAPPFRFVVTGLMFEPHVFGVLSGQRIFFEPGAGQAHYCLTVKPKRNDGFSTGLAAGETYSFTFPEPENAIPIFSDCYSWMRAKCFVKDHPFFATTDAAGRFSIEELPPGRHTLVAWHENFGTTEVEIDVAAGQAASVELSLAR